MLGWQPGSAVQQEYPRHLRQGLTAVIQKQKLNSSPVNRIELRKRSADDVLAGSAGQSPAAESWNGFERVGVA
jgi:hypothetical protein